jgi:type I restriction enzyme S subunit
MRDGFSRISVSELVSRGALLVTDGYRVRNVELSDVGIPFVRGGDIGNGSVNTLTEDHIASEFASRVANKLSRPEDVVFITKGTVGRVGFLRDGQPQVVFAPQVCCWRVLDKAVLEPRFVFYLLQSRQFQANLDAVKTHGSMVADYVSISDQMRFSLTIPSISDQRAIACVLSALDDKIELNQRMNETLEAMAQALFKSWFVDATQNGLPEGWSEAPLDKVAKFLNGLALQKFPPDGGDSLPVIKISQLRTGNTRGADRATANLSSEYVVEDGDILFSWSGSLEVVIWCGGPGALNQHLFKVTSDKYPKWFYYLWTKFNLPDFQAIASAKATTMGHIQRYHLSQAGVAVPPDEDLQRMDTTIAPVIEKIIANNVEARTLAALRDALLPKLLSGQIRVNASTNTSEEFVHA